MGCRVVSFKNSDLADKQACFKAGGTGCKATDFDCFASAAGARLTFCSVAFIIQHHM